MKVLSREDLGVLRIERSGMCIWCVSVHTHVHEWVVLREGKLGSGKVEGPPVLCRILG